MSETKQSTDNVKEKDWGYELTWAKKENYGAKIYVFQKPGKTPFVMNLQTAKSYFVNAGVFQFRWIDKDGKIFQSEVKEGAVLECLPATPYSLECTTSNGSVTEANSGHIENDERVVITTDRF